MSTRREIIDRGRLARLSRATDFYMNIPTMIESPLSYRIGGSPLVCQRHAPSECHFEADGHGAELGAVAAAQDVEGFVFVVDAHVVHNDFCPYAH